MPSHSEDKLDIHYVAQLSRLALTQDQERLFAGQLKQILSYVEQLNELDVAGIEPTSHAFDVTNIVREDEVRPSLPPEVALRNAPQQENQLFIVPKVVE